MFSTMWQIHILEQLTWSCVATLELGTKIPVNVVRTPFRIVKFSAMSRVRQSGGNLRTGWRQQKAVASYLVRS
jgi:hypothetical protein